jgi:hypothetical protein
MTHPYWATFIKQAQASGLDTIQTVGLYTVATHGGARETDEDFFHALEKSGMDLSDLHMVVQMIQKRADDEATMQDSGEKEEHDIELMKSIQDAQTKIETPMQESAEKAEASEELMETLQDAQCDGETDSLEEQGEMQNRGAGTDKLAQLAYLEGYAEVMQKAAAHGFGDSDFGDSGFGGGNWGGAGGSGGSVNMHIPEGIGTGINAMGLAQLMNVDPNAAGLVRAQMEAAAAVNAMRPFEGISPWGVGAGALAGAGLGGLMGAGWGSVADRATGSAPGAIPGAGIGALGGGIMGGGMGALLSKSLEAQTRYADAYKRALARYEAGA